MDVPPVRFAKLGQDRIAYQVVGDGPVDLVWVSELGDALDARWEYPPYVRFLRRLASFTRLIMFDRRGLGASDPVSLEALPKWEAWTDDAMAVMDAVGSERAALLGCNQSGQTAVLFAATRPERAQSLVLFTCTARVLEYADAGETLVSAAVPLLVTGSGLEFEDRGEHDLKGVPGSWRLFAVEGD